MPEPDHTPSAPDTVLGVLSCGRRGNAWVVTLGGDLGPDALAGVSRQLDAVVDEGRAVVVDTKSVTSADPAMLTLLMRLQEAASLYVAAPSPPVRALLEAAGPNASVRTVTSLGEALDALGAGSS
ncbi:STAS domain-containing protein [Streptomyces sp. WMMC940]|uniref:STAS domain-containing protein n=1 Tax=Streptomyces sp. WMMC940 TaxID=3015153 RepID=UPI0022B72A3D|nr:STAS domain-containing protein [Streptomyces sp. WMMC940]MCZ7456553.1 STAS domain-containing protein [Streptomyces sp. WMMC940]